MDLRKEKSYRISSSHPRTLTLAVPGFLFFMGLAIASFSALPFYPDHQLLLVAGFILGIPAAIGWMFFALIYGKRQYEKNAPLTVAEQRADGMTKGKQT
ncbi:hypothetical protein [uncultured Sulfitobacter sp.]|uniref:hypothetical protein n=1 Tax=uncultured Sulfitobacter sp. TaxID=191468 RepID=UPI00260C307A|nr:hypothetical protein [uncultured Sulfitobacter sp.]